MYYAFLLLLDWALYVIRLVNVTAHTLMHMHTSKAYYFMLSWDIITKCSTTHFKGNYMLDDQS